MKALKRIAAIALLTATGTAIAVPLIVYFEDVAGLARSPKRFGLSAVLIDTSSRFLFPPSPPRSPPPLLRPFPCRLGVLWDPGSFGLCHRPGAVEEQLASGSRGVDLLGERP